MSPWGDTLTEQLRGDISIDQQHRAIRSLTTFRGLTYIPACFYRITVRSLGAEEAPRSRALTAIEALLGLSLFPARVLEGLRQEAPITLLLLQRSDES